MLYQLLEVKPENRRGKIYIPPHKQYIELLKEDAIMKSINEEDSELEVQVVDYYNYAVSRIPYRVEFDQLPEYNEKGEMLKESYIEQNFDTLFNEEG